MRASAVAWVVATCLAGGCASEVQREAAAFVAAGAEAGRLLVSTTAIEARPASGYPRSIAAGTEFAVVGSVAQGLVLRPTQTVLTVEGAHMHEAYAVHRDGALVGFYLPVERAYSALPRPVPMPLEERKSR